MLSIIESDAVKEPVKVGWMKGIKSAVWCSNEAGLWGSR